VRRLVGRRAVLAARDIGETEADEGDALGEERETVEAVRTHGRHHTPV
jgi:hypothetical protein